MTDKNQFSIEAVSKELQEIEDLFATIQKQQADTLAKSAVNPMAKAEGDSAPEADEPPPAAATDDMVPPPPEEASQEVTPDQEANELHDEMEGEGETFEDVLAELDDEDIAAMEASIQAEKARRQGGDAGQDEAPEDQGMAQQAQDEQMADMQKTVDGLQKSIRSLSDTVSKFKKENDTLKKSVTDLTEKAKKPAVVTAKPTIMNKGSVTTLEKSTQAPEMLSKSSLIQFAHEKQRAKDPIWSSQVGRDAVYALNKSSTPAELRAVYQECELKGIKLPMKS